MPFVKGKPRPPNAGRRAGTPNALTVQFRESVQRVYSMIGGDAHMASWAQKEPTEYYRIAARLIPHELTGAGGGPIQLAVQVIDELHPEIRTELEPVRVAPKAIGAGSTVETPSLVIQPKRENV